MITKEQRDRLEKELRDVCGFIKGIPYSDNKIDAVLDEILKNHLPESSVICHAELVKHYLEELNKLKDEAESTGLQSSQEVNEWNNQYDSLCHDILNYDWKDIMGYIALDREQNRDVKLHEKFTELHKDLVDKVISWCKENNVVGMDTLQLEIDGIEYSREFGRWTPSTDSYLDLNKTTDIQSLLDNKKESDPNDKLPFLSSY